MLRPRCALATTSTLCINLRHVPSLGAERCIVGGSIRDEPSRQVRTVGAVLAIVIKKQAMPQIVVEIAPHGVEVLARSHCIVGLHQ